MRVFVNRFDKLVVVGLPHLLIPKLLMTRGGWNRFD